MKCESVPSARTHCEDLLRVALQTDSNEAKSTRTKQKYCFDWCRLSIKQSSPLTWTGYLWRCLRTFPVWKVTDFYQSYLWFCDLTHPYGCIESWMFACVCVILLCLSRPPPVRHCEAFISVPFLCRQGRGRRAHACDPVWLHHALGHLEQHPEERPEPALPDGLWMQGKTAEDCVCDLSPIVSSPGGQNQT